MKISKSFIILCLSFLLYSNAFCAFSKADDTKKLPVKYLLKLTPEYFHYKVSQNNIKVYGNVWVFYGDVQGILLPVNTYSVPSCFYFKNLIVNVKGLNYDINNNADRLKFVKKGLSLLKNLIPIKVYGTSGRVVTTYLSYQSDGLYIQSYASVFQTLLSKPTVCRAI